MILNKIGPTASVILLTLMGSGFLANNGGASQIQAARKDQPDSTYSVGPQAICAVVNSSSSASFSLVGGGGQMTGGESASASYGLIGGFWDFSEASGCCVGTRGDVNGDGANLDIVDLTCVVDFLFGEGCDMPCPEEADVNGDAASADIVDLTFIVDYLFGESPTPVVCP